MYTMGPPIDNSNQESVCNLIIMFAIHIILLLRPDEKYSLSPVLAFCARIDHNITHIHIYYMYTKTQWTDTIEKIHNV